MEFSLNDFANSIRDTLYTEFPYEGKALKELKHKKTPLHIRDVAFKNNPVIVDGNTIMFDIGNDYSEEHYPYYHILEDSYAIRKRNRGTTKSRGSQARVESLKDRNYAMPVWNGKTFVKEYQRNVRGSRNRLKSVSRWVENANGERQFINREANSYLNVHYHYIEKTLDSFLGIIASQYGLKSLRKQDSGFEGLAEELAVDWGEETQTVIDIFGSHEEN